MSRWSYISCTDQLSITWRPKSQAESWAAAAQTEIFSFSAVFKKRLYPFSSTLSPKLPKSSFPKKRVFRFGSRGSAPCIPYAGKIGFLRSGVLRGKNPGARRRSLWDSASELSAAQLTTPNSIAWELLFGGYKGFSGDEYRRGRLPYREER